MNTATIIAALRESALTLEQDATGAMSAGVAERLRDLADTLAGKHDVANPERTWDRKGLDLGVVCRVDSEDLEAQVIRMEALLQQITGIADRLEAVIGAETSAQIVDVMDQATAAASASPGFGEQVRQAIEREFTRRDREVIAHHQSAAVRPGGGGSGEGAIVFIKREVSQEGLPVETFDQATARAKIVTDQDGHRWQIAAAHDEVGAALARASIPVTTETIAAYLEGRVVPPVYADPQDEPVTITAPTSLTRDAYFASWPEHPVHTNGYRVFIKGPITIDPTMPWPFVDSPVREPAPDQAGNLTMAAQPGVTMPDDEPAVEVEPGDLPCANCGKPKWMCDNRFCGIDTE